MMEGAPLSSSRPRLWRPLAISVITLLVGLAITAVLAWAAAAANSRNSRSLLTLETRQAAASLTAALPSVQSQLSDALTVASDTNSARVFEKFLGDNPRHSTVAAESLWEKRAGGFHEVADVGAPLALMRDGRAAQFFAHLHPSPVLQVTGILPGSPPRVGFAEFPPGSAKYAVYAESRLPANERLKVSSSSAFSQLNFAFYLGHDTKPSQLIAASARTPISVSHATATVPFGDSALTLVATTRLPLTSELSRSLWWIVVLGGILLSLGSACLVEYSGRRRRLAEELSAELATMYAGERSIAETLQRSLLPSRLPDVNGMDIAARYLPGAQGVDVGGDWYDVVVLDEERFVFVVGDVSGRGVRAGAVMASLRFAGRGFALEGHPPAGILTQLGRMLDFASDEHFATVLCGLVDVGRHEVTFANAGHLPPVLVSGGTATALVIPPSPPIGVARDAAEPLPAVHIPAGATLLAYTDGLVERRGRTLDEAIERLKKCAVQPSGSLDDLLSRIVSDLTMDAPDDDIAIVALRWTN